MLTIYLVRHGKTEHNLEGITMGQIDSPLTEEGFKNAEVIAGLLPPVDHIYSSDLGRAYITAQIINVKLSSPITPERRLREINYGIFANRKKDEVKVECPEYKTDLHYVFPEGESYAQVQARSTDFVQSLEPVHDNQTVLLVAHSGVIRSLQCHFRGFDFQDHLKMPVSHEYIGKFVIDNGKLVSYIEVN